MLIVRVGAMGDVLHALPAVTALRDAHPECDIGWAIEPRWAPLLRSASKQEAEAVTLARPLVNRIHFVESRKWSAAPFSIGTLRSIRALRRDLRSAQYDLCIDLQGSIRSAVIGRMSGASAVVGPMRPREAAAWWMYQQKVATHRAHVVEQGCEILSAALGEAIAPAVPRLPVDRDAESWATAFIHDVLGQTGASSLAIVAPGAGWGAKRWPAARYGEVAAGLAAEGHVVLINAGPGEDELADSVLKAARDERVRVAPCGIAQLAALLRRTSLFVGGDTGPLHLAAALQCPVVGIYGPTDPARNGPYFGPYFDARFGASSGTEPRNAPRSSIILRGGGSVTDHARRSEPDAALLSIAPRQALDAAFSLLKESQGSENRNTVDGEAR